MRFSVAHDPAALAAYLPNFLVLAGGDRFRKRVVQLARDMQASPAHEKIVGHYHWLEMALSEQMIINEHVGQLIGSQVSIQALERCAFRLVHSLHFESSWCTHLA